MIRRQYATEERILGATCDCCGADIKLNRYYGGGLDDHLMIGGFQGGKILEAIVCIKCMEEKLGFINIQRKNSSIGFC